ncbi:MAG: hypothetical protein KF895_02895 [Parvibaculum sp.]|nr:hypothetical protein [Parvibaculum sp.]
MASAFGWTPGQGQTGWNQPSTRTRSVMLPDGTALPASGALAAELLKLAEASGLKVTDDTPSNRPGAFESTAQTGALMAQQNEGYDPVAAYRELLQQNAPEPDTRGMKWKDLGDEDKGMILMKAGLGMMAAGGQPGAGFLDSVAQGGLQGLSAFDNIQNTRRAARDAAAKEAKEFARWGTEQGIKADENRMAREDRRADRADTKAYRDAQLGISNARLGLDMERLERDAGGLSAADKRILDAVAKASEVPDQFGTPIVDPRKAVRALIQQGRPDLAAFYGYRPPLDAPADLSAEPDGTIVEDDNGDRFEKRGNKLIPVD